MLWNNSGVFVPAERLLLFSPALNIYTEIIILATRPRAGWPRNGGYISRDSYIPCCVVAAPIEFKFK
jgi:hypothetical protein